MDRRCVVFSILYHLPDMFPAKQRLADANAHVNEFNASTHTYTSYKSLIERIEIEFDPEDGSDTRNFLGDPQQVRMPFSFEEEIQVCVVQQYPNDETDELADRLGSVQYHSVLEVVVMSTAKPKARATPTARVIGTPRDRMNV